MAGVTALTHSRLALCLPKRWMNVIGAEVIVDSTRITLKKAKHKINCNSNTFLMY